MSLNPLTPVTDYPSMLNRIFWFTAAAALVAIWILRHWLSGLDLFLGTIDLLVEFGDDQFVPVPGGSLLPALAVGLLSRVFRIHARISDWLGIRECFDVDVIITELARRVGFDVSLVEREWLVERRHPLMRETFYAFTSGSRPQVDPQLVAQALDAWSWFWIGVEATLVFVLASFVLLAGGVYDVGFELLGGTMLVAAVGLPALRGQCRRYAIAQVRAILASPARADVVRAVFAEFSNPRTTVRRAA